MMLWVSMKCLILLVVGVAIALSLDGLSDDSKLALSIAVGALGFFLWFSHGWGLGASVFIIEFLLLFLIFFLFFNLSFYGHYFHSSVLILVPVDAFASLHVVVRADHVNNVCMCMG